MYAEKITSINRHPVNPSKYGVLQSVDEDSFLIHSQADIFTARRAFSCLVNPEAGDRVMFCRDDEQQYYILAIIDRPLRQGATLSFKGDVAIESAHGDVSVTGSKGIQLLTTESLTLGSNEVNVLAKTGNININDAVYTGDKVTSHIRRLMTFAESIDTVADRFSQNLKNSFRIIQGMDQTKAGDILTTIKNLFSIHASQTAIIAKKDIKIDAERIHMG